MKQLTIGIEATQAGSLGAERHGIFRYLQQLLIGFKAVESPHRFRLWFNSFRNSGINGIPAFVEEIGWPHVEVAISRLPSRVRKYLNIPIDRSLGRIDLFHGTNHLLPIVKKSRTVVTIHDLACFRMSENLHDLNSEWSRAIMKHSPNPKTDLLSYRLRCNYFLILQKNLPETLSRADMIIAVSQATAQDITDIAKVHESKIRVVLLGLTKGLSPVNDRTVITNTLASLNIRQKYILYIGVLDPNKDLHTLLAGFANASPEFRKDHKLIIAGPKNWFQAVLEDEAERLGIKDSVMFTGYVPDSVLLFLYSGATASVSLSPLEGFGFPALESMACGCPVIVADAGALPEVAGDAAIRISPGNAHALAGAMEKIAGDCAFVQELVKRGIRRSEEFTWEKTARQTQAVYEEVAG